MHIEDSLSVVAQIEEVPRICEWVTNIALKVGMPQKAVQHVELSVDEICTNIVEHGYGQHTEQDHHSNKIELLCKSDGEQFLIIIADDSPPFNPLELPDPDPSKPLDQRPEYGGGWGVSFVKTLMDHVWYDYRTHRNYLYMVKGI